MRSSQVRLAILAASVAGILGRLASATMVLPLTLTEMTGQADRIFVGRCLDITSDLDPSGYPATYLRLEVLEPLKGVARGERILVKQFGAAPTRTPIREGERRILPFFSAPARVATEIGQESLLFLYPDSSQGFTSPVGLGQGKFLITPKDHGKADAVQALGLSGERRAEKDLQSLIEEIRRILR